MEKPTIEAMAERLERLERENRRWRRAGSVAAVVGLAALLAGGARKDDVPGTVQASRFLLKGKDGATCGEWGVADKLGWPVFRLYDAAGDPCLTLMAIKDPGSPMILLNGGTDRRSGIAMKVHPDGTPMLSFNDKNGKLVLRLPEEQGPPPAHPQPAPR